MEAQIQAVRQRLADARAITALTGAGVSAESGVPTFRGPEGLWRNYRAEELATPEAFSRDPQLVWAWYNWRRELIAKTVPNAAHYALATLERRTPHFTLITQNVDGLHRQARSGRVIELHGNIWTVRCTRCGQIAPNFQVPIPILPHCEAAQCGGLLRPHIVWFGEALDPEDLDQAVAAARSCEVILVIGTSGVVQPAASLAGAAKATGAFVVEVNPTDTAQSELADVALRGPAAEILPQLL